MTPPKWHATFLGDVVSLVAGTTPKGVTEHLIDGPAPIGNVPFFKVGDMNLDPVYLRDARVSLTKDAAQRLNMRLVPEGAVVFPKAGGAIATNKKRVIAVSGAIDLNCMAAVPGPEIDGRFLRLWFESIDLSRLSDGSVLPQLSKRTMASVPVLLPPLGEQRRIVDLLEDHLSRLDAAEAGLARSRRGLVVLEGAALRDSLEGPLVALSELAQIQGGIQKQPKRAPAANAFPFLRVANVTKHGLDLDDVHQVELFDGELERLRLERGDLLVVEGNGSASQIGRAALWDGSIADCVHQNHLIRVRATGSLLPGYLEAVWNSPAIRTQLSDLASSSSGLHTLSVSKLKSLRIPVPPRHARQPSSPELTRSDKRGPDLMRNWVVRACVARDCAVPCSPPRFRVGSRDHRWPARACLPQVICPPAG